MPLGCILAVFCILLSWSWSFHETQDGGHLIGLAVAKLHRNDCLRPLRGVSWPRGGRERMLFDRMWRYLLFSLTSARCIAMHIFVWKAVQGKWTCLALLYVRVHALCSPLFLFLSIACQPADVYQPNIQVCVFLPIYQYDTVQYVAMLRRLNVLSTFCYIHRQIFPSEARRISNQSLRRIPLVFNTLIWILLEIYRFYPFSYAFLYTYIYHFSWNMV